MTSRRQRARHAATVAARHAVHAAYCIRMFALGALGGFLITTYMAYATHNSNC